MEYQEILPLLFAGRLPVASMVYHHFLEDISKTPVYLRLIVSDIA